MANKRDFKKDVDAIGSSVCEPMFVAYHTTTSTESAEKIEKAIAKVLAAVAAARSNADVTFDKGVKAFDSLKEYSKAKKDFYKKLFQKISEDFNSEIDAALKDFNATIPQEVKDANKEIASK